MILGVAHTETIDLGVKLGLATEEITQEVLDFLLGRRTGVGDVVVTRQMKRWHALHTLALVYRDGFNNQLNDRYKAKVFSSTRDWRRRLGSRRFISALGWCISRWSVAAAPDFSFTSGSLEAATYFARVAWVSASGAEGLASAITTYDSPPGTVPIVEVVESAP